MIEQRFYSSGYPYPELQIDQGALLENFRLIRKIAGEKTRILIPVKANAYGCGLTILVPVFQQLQPDYLGVANPWEGKLLRDSGWEGKIVNLGGFYPESTGLFFEHQLIPSLTDLWQIEQLGKLADGKKSKISVHIKLDLGMGRIGIKPEDVDQMIEQLKEYRSINVEGIFTHFPSADLTEAKQSTTDMVERLKELSGLIIDRLEIARESVIIHSANSSALMFHPESHLDMVRPGLGFYGYFQTFEEWESYRKEFPFKPSVHLTAFPVSIRHMNKGESISYGSTYTVEEDNYPVGVVPLGYADGIPRAISNRISFQDCPLHGRVTMDQVVLGGLTELEKPVVLIGDGSPPLEKWAELSSTTTYEILTGLGHRLKRTLM